MRIDEDAVYLGQRTAGDGRLSGRLSPGTLHYRPRRRVVLEVLLHDLTALNVLILLAKILGFVVVTWVLSAKLLPPAILFLRRFIRVPELSFGLLLGGLFLVVVGAEEIGLHGTIGALLFGAALSGLPQGVRHDPGHGSGLRTVPGHLGEP